VQLFQLNHNFVLARPYSSASQPFWCRGPLFAETLILGPLYEKFVSELMTRRIYCVISEHFVAHRLRSAALQ